MTTTLEAIEREIGEMKKNLVVDNWEDGQPKNCNPRCHDSGKDSALTDILAIINKYTPPSK